MPVLAVSFCNQGDAATLLALFDTETGIIEPVLVNDGTYQSACGLVRSGSLLYCALARRDSTSCVLAIVDWAARQVVDYRELPGVVDVHSIAIAGDSFLIVSTGTDEVFQFARSGGAGEVLWRASKERDDTHHVNAICVGELGILCCAFGPRHGARWADAIDGYIVNIEGGETIARGLYHPHSLVQNASTLYLCESGRNAFRTLDATLAYTDGYTRGLCIDAGGTAFIGSSVGRRGGVPGTIQNASDPGERAGACAIHRTGVRSNDRLSRVDFARTGSEIYDLAIIE